jgi:DNA-directed RNA polymerase specialized sigma24 family protein
VPWLYGVAGNVAADLHRRRARRSQAEDRLAGRLLLDADDYAWVEELFVGYLAYRDASKIPQCANFVDPSTGDVPAWPPQPR